MNEWLVTSSKGELHDVEAWRCGCSDAGDLIFWNADPIGGELTVRVFAAGTWSGCALNKPTGA